jgi:N-acetylneuraminic acid mutarotase
MNYSHWKIGGQMPLPRAGCAVGAVNSHVIVAGGTHWADGKKYWVDRCDRLDPISGRWESLPPLPRPVGDGATAVVGDLFHVIGGGSDGIGSTDVWSLQAGRWQAALAPLPAPRRSVTAVVHGGDIIVLGGLAGLPTDYASATNTVWRSGAGGWRTLAPMPGPARIGFAAGVFGDRLIVAGGFMAEGAGVRNLAEVLAYDFFHDAWSQIGQLPQPRRGITGVALPKGGLLAFGGYTDAFSAEVLFIDPTRGAVRVAGMLPKPVADARFALCAGRLIGVTGEDGMKMRWADWVSAEPAF